MFADSITDGRCSTRDAKGIAQPNLDQRWGDVVIARLAERAKTDAAFRKAVAIASISGNRVLGCGNGPSAFCFGETEGYTAPMNTQLLEQARKLSIDEQLELIEVLWENIAADGGAPLTPAQKDELDRRVADLDAHPDDVVPWSEVKAEALSRIRRNGG